MSSSETPLTGADRIAAYLKTLPDAPGVYRMLNAAGDVLYVGKAKSLKKRVSSYARGGVHSERLTRMIAETAEMLFLTTESDPEMKQQAKAAGATGWITKPFQQDQLVAIVRKVLG